MEDHEDKEYFDMRIDSLANDLVRFVSDYEETDEVTALAIIEFLDKFFKHEIPQELTLAIGNIFHEIQSLSREKLHEG